MSEWTSLITAITAVGGIVYALMRMSFVTRDEFIKALDSRHQANSEKLQRIEEKLDSSQIGVISARLSRAEQDVQDLRDWKHKVDPFIERRILP